MRLRNIKSSFQICFVIFLGSFLNADELQRLDQKTGSLIQNIAWIENACIKIIGSQTVYFDPYRIRQKDSADIIFVTHDHGDHFSRIDIEKIQCDHTIIVGPAYVTKSIDTNKQTVKAGDAIQIKDVKIQVVASYNLHIENHAKHKGHVGYIVTMDHVSYYHPGDSDFIPEMQQVKADVAFLPVCGTYMMSAEEAVEAAKVIQPEVVIPIHWGSVFGSKADAERLSSLYTGKTVILEME